MRVTAAGHYGQAAPAWGPCCGQPPSLLHKEVRYLLVTCPAGVKGDADFIVLQVSLDIHHLSGQVPDALRCTLLDQVSPQLSPAHPAARHCHARVSCSC